MLIYGEITTIERSKILHDFRLGKYDVLVGVNLLREGIDIPELSLLTIFDADQEGFLRNATSLIQMIGRVARNINGKVIMYANSITRSMKAAIDETYRRRKIQIEYNKKHHLKPKSIIKPLVSILNDRSFVKLIVIQKNKFQILNLKK